MDLNEKLKCAQQHKEEGNTKFKEKDYTKAVGKYHRALLYVKGIEASSKPNPVQCMMGGTPPSPQDYQIPDELKPIVLQLKADCNNNLAACLLQKKPVPYQRVIECCDAVLEFDATNAKALYRKASAKYSNKDYETALELFTEAQKQPDGLKDVRIPKFIDACKKAIHIQDREMKETCRNMFKNLSTRSDDM